MGMSGREIAKPGRFYVIKAITLPNSYDMQPQAAHRYFDAKIVPAFACVFISSIIATLALPTSLDDGVSGAGRTVLKTFG